MQRAVGDALCALFGGAFVVAVERHGQYADDGAADGKRDGDEGQAEEVEDVEEGVEVAFEFFRLAVFGDVVDAFFHDGLFVFAQEDAACLPAAFLSGNGKDGNGGVGGGAAVVVGEGADVEEQVFVTGHELDEAVAFFVIPVDDASLVGAAGFQL